MPQERNFYRVYFYDHLYVQGLKEVLGKVLGQILVCPVRAGVEAMTLGWQNSAQRLPCTCRG